MPLRIIKKEGPAFGASTALPRAPSTTERCLGCNQRLRNAVNDKIGLEPAALRQLADLTAEFMMPDDSRRLNICELQQGCSRIARL